MDKNIRQQGLLYGYSTEWAATIAGGSFIIAGENFGCGSSREVTAAVFKDRGIRLVCAQSFARIFYRNMVNLGIGLCHIVSEIPWKEGEKIPVRLSSDETRLIDDSNRQIILAPPSDFARKIIANGGLLNSIDHLFRQL
jgi:3-isopropylmalate/(R)-2-methylmalate dehydratase small subunit